MDNEQYHNTMRRRSLLMRDGLALTDVAVLGDEELDRMIAYRNIWLEKLRVAKDDGRMNAVELRLDAVEGDLHRVRLRCDAKASHHNARTALAVFFSIVSLGLAAVGLLSNR